ncbi:MAG: lysophospholipid acyltransferase family protein [Myxococcota bacterium]
MLDLPRMERIRLSAKPRVQRLIALSVLVPNYELPPRVRIQILGADTLPREPVIFAMNHTDRYNYWPFQYRLWRMKSRYTATWVKGKYYQNRAMGTFMELTNNIPTVSRGYLISRDFVNTVGRPPSAEEYAALRAMVEARDPGEIVLPRELFERSRDMLGYRFDAGRETYAAALDALFQAMMARFVALNGEALDLGLDVLVFPQGTRSIRLSKGHIGLGQIALHFKRPIVPVGCSGSDKVYPSGAPIGRPGRIVYRIGKTIPYEEMKPFHIDEPFQPFTPEAEERHRDRFQGLVDVVMDRINDLVDEPYKWGDDQESDGVAGTRRFV